LGSSADVALARENATRPAAERWSRLPYGESGLMMTRLLDGTIEGMVVFGPVYASLSATRPEEAARLHMAELPPSLRISSNIGGLMLSQNAFLRSEVDRVIAEMTADGTIARLLEEHGFGDIPAIPGGV